jgi:hypothetical protein
MNSTLRNLYLFRVAFSALWVALVTLAGSKDHPGDTVSLLAGLLLNKCRSTIVATVSAGT